MENIPPKQEIVIERNIGRTPDTNNTYKILSFSNDLYRQMEFQMQIHELDLEQFVTYAVELYIDELLKRETQEKKWINFSEGQFFTAKSEPIDIKQESDDDEDIFKGL